MPQKSSKYDSSEITKFLESRVPAPLNDFRRFNKKYLFVDKTELIAKLAGEKRMCVFNRPSGFGMTAMLQSLENFFERDAQFFQGLKGEAAFKAFKDKAPPQVVHLDFANMTAEVPFESRGNESKDYARELTININNKCESLNIYYDLDELADYEKRRDDPWGLDGLFDDDEDEDFLGFFFGIHEMRYPKPATMLEAMIDDLPTGSALIIENFDDALFECSGRQKVVEEIFDCLKAVFNEVADRRRKGDLGFAIITGKMPWNFWAEEDDYVDLSRDPQYAALLGFTAAELKEYMGPELKLAASRHFCKDSAEVTDDEVEELLQLMAQHFGNYCFAPGVSEGLYCPVDLFDYFKHGLFKDTAQGKRSGKRYSFSSNRAWCSDLLGTQGMRKALAHLGHLQGLGTKEPVLVDKKGSSSEKQYPSEGINPLAILYAFGYYSLPLNSPVGVVQYCMPNAYAADGLSQLIHDNYLPVLKKKKDQRALLFQEILDYLQEEAKDAAADADKEH